MSNESRDSGFSFTGVSQISEGIMKAKCTGCGVTDTLGTKAIKSGRTTFYCATVAAYCEIEIVDDTPGLPKR